MTSPLVDRIKLQQKEDPELRKISKIEEGKGREFSLKSCAFWIRDQLCVPNVPESKELLKEAHDSTLITHPGSTKMCYDLRRYFWWIGMKMDIADYVARCLTCQWVKTEH